MTLICRHALLTTAYGFLLLLIGCARTGDPASNVRAKYDDATGKLRQLTLDADRDGKPNIVSHMDGSKFVRIEIDRDENGLTDRWEYYGADQRLEKVGISRSNDGVVDAWLFEGSDGRVAKIEIATKRDGKVNRREFYEAGQLTRAEEDTNGDGLVDRWEAYENGTLTSVSFDVTKSGKPTTTIDYREKQP